MKLFILLFILNFNKFNAQNNVKQKKANEKKKVNPLITSIVNEIIEKQELIKSANKKNGGNGNGDEANRLLKKYISPNDFTIDKKMDAKIQEFQKKSQNFNQNIRGEYQQNIDNWSQSQQQQAGISIQSLDQTISVRYNEVIQKYKNDKETAIKNLIELLKNKLSNEGHNYNLNIEELVLYSKIDKNDIYYVELNEVVDAFLDSQIDVKTYKFPEFPEVSGFFDKISSEI